MPRKDQNQFWIEYLVAFVASITTVGYGCSHSWTSPALPFLKSGKSNLSLEKEELAWIAPLLPIGMIIGIFINPIFIDRIGRKWTLLLFSIPQIASWFLILLANNSKTICIGRILGGIGYGGGICAIIVYLSEIGNRKNRGIFLTFIKVSSSFGMFLTNFLGTFLSYFHMNLCLLVMPIIFVIIFPFMPNSSYFYEKNKEIEEEEKLKFIIDNDLTKTENCKTCIIKEDYKGEEINYVGRKKDLNEESNLKKDNNLRKDEVKEDSINSKTAEFEGTCKLNNGNVKEDFKLKTDAKLKKGWNKRNVTVKVGRKQEYTKKDIEDGYSNVKPECEKEDCKTCGNFKSNNLEKRELNNFQISSRWKLLTNRSNLKALFIICNMVMLDCFLGHAIFVYFSQQLLTYEGSLISPKKGALVVVTTKLIASVAATQIIERFKRKTILFYTGILSIVTLGILSMFFYLEHCQLKFRFLSPLPYFAFLIYEIVTTIGTSNLLYILQGELFHSDVKGLSVTIIKIFHMLMIFITVVIYQSLIEFFNLYVIFLLFCICSIILCTICLIVIPETKGKTLDEIQILLQEQNYWFKSSNT